MAANAPKKDNTDTESTFIIDSAADPTHLRKPTPDIAPLNIPIITHTATNHASKCTHHVKALILKNNGKSIPLQAVANPSISHNLLSVHDFTRTYGPIIFTARQAALIDSRSAQHSRIISVAPWNPHTRAYKLLPHYLYHVRSARTLTPVHHHTVAPSLSPKITNPPLKLAPSPPLNLSLPRSYLSQRQ